MELALNPAEQQELLSFLQALVRFPTEDPPGREIELARFLHDTLAGWGLVAELDEFAPGRANVIARLNGGEAPGLAFSAHTDTMPVGTREWTHPPFAAEVVDGKVYGRGTADMKGGLAAMAFAAKRLHDAGVSLKGPLVLAFSAGESSSCLGAKRMVAVDALHDVGALLISEPSTLGVVIAEMGALWLRVAASGTAGHASAGGAGDNAILKILAAGERLRGLKLEGEQHPLLGGPTLRINTIAGGSAINLTPDHAELGVDIRYPPGMEGEAIRARVAAALGEGVAVTVIDDKPPVAVAPGHPLVAACLAACRDVLGSVPEPGGVSYFSDATVLSTKLGLPRVIVGPGALGMSGARDEYVTVERLVGACEIYMRVALGWLGDARRAG